MADLVDVFQFWGADVTLSPTAGFAPASAEDRSQLRVLRRLMTPPGSYAQHPTYGAGLPGLIGSTIEPAKVRALIRGQMRQEASVAPKPEPVVKVTPHLNSMGVDASYTVQPSGVPVTLSFTVKP